MKGSVLTQTWITVEQTVETQQSKLPTTAPTSNRPLAVPKPPQSMPSDPTAALGSAREQLQSLEELADSLKEQFVLQRQNPNGIYLRAAADLAVDIRELFSEIAYKRGECDRLWNFLASLPVPSASQSSGAELWASSRDDPTDPRGQKRRRAVVDDPYL